MTRTFAGAATAAFAAFGILAQSPAAPVFEVASIKPAPAQPSENTSTRTSINPARVIFSNVTVGEIIQKAYRVQEFQVTGPASLGTWRFDVAAKIPDGVAQRQVPEMLQTLLAERFKLALHRETRAQPVYALTVAKSGPKLKASESATGISSNSNRSGVHVNARVSIPSFAEFLSIRLGRPVLDKTGLTGNFEITVDWAPDPIAQGAPALDAAAGPSVFTALQEQLGLKLEATKGPVEILVIDHVEQPTEN